MDSDAKKFVHHSHGTCRHRIKCWIMHQLIFTIQLSKKFKKRSSLYKIKSRNSKRNKVEGSAVTQWWQQVYWFDSASECPQCFQKRELVILIATTSSN
jgi:hypothetical protein